MLSPMLFLFKPRAKQLVRFFSVSIVSLGIFLLFNLKPVSAAGPTYIYNDIEQPTTWTLDGSPYVIEPGIGELKKILIKAELTIEPGVVVKFEPNHWNRRYAALEVDGAEGGRLLASGTADRPIVFTSYYDNDYDTVVGNDKAPQKGDWSSLRFYADNSILEHVIVRYASEIYTAMSELEFHDSSQAQISHSFIELSNGSGAILDGGAKPVLDDVTFQYNNGAALRLFSATGPGILKNSRIQFNSGECVLKIDANSLFKFENNSYHSNQSSVNCLKGTANREVTWYNLGLPYLLRASVGPAGIVHIEPGTIFKFDLGVTNAYHLLVDGGRLYALGTADRPIIFTSWRDDSAGGDSNHDGYDTAPAPRDWSEIYFQNHAAGEFDYVQIRYGGEYHGDFSGVVFGTNRHNMLGAENSDLKVSHSKIQFSQSYGLLIKGDSSVDLQDNEFSHNGTGLAVGSGLVELPVIKHNNFFDNSAYALNYWGITPQLDATYNWWGSDSGPTHPDNPNGTGDKITGNVLYDPWLGKTQDLDPVIIVPGIMGSKLFDPVPEEVWPNITLTLADPWDLHLNKLRLPENGEPSGNSLMYVGDIIRQISTSDYWQGLIDELKNNGYKENENLFVFPYDWRLNLDWLAGDPPIANINNLKDKIEAVKTQTGAQKVDIIAHSMGGLIVKRYLTKYGPDSVDQFIDIATPHLGAPKAFKILMYGDDMGFNLLGVLKLNPERVKFISQNMPAVYQLLPSQAYFDVNNPGYRSYIADIYDLDNNNIKGNLNYQQSIDFMANTGRNEYLLGFNDNLHSQIDNYSPPLDNIKTYNIIGSGLATIGKVYVLNKEKTGKYEYALKYINGDSTVPFRSADYLEANKTYYSGAAEHAQLPSADGIKQLITAILLNKEDNFDFSNYNNLTTDLNDVEKISGTQISFHSPIELHVYDEDNNHLGPDENGDIEYGIPGAQYDVIDNNKFVFLPLGHTYRIVGRATDVGSFNTRVQNIDNGNYTQTVYYNEVPLNSTETNVELTITGNQTDYTMQIDQDGDGNFESTIQPSAILDEQASQDYTKPTTNINLNGILGNNSWYVSNVTVELTAQDNTDGSGILKTEYSLDNGQTWQLYNQPFVLSDEGEHELWYMSTDRAGNIEKINKITIKIDKTPPTINFINPQEGQLFFRPYDLEVKYLLTDTASGIDKTKTKVEFNNLDITHNLILDFFNYHLGQHQIVVYAQDLAGNYATQQANFEVGANIDSTINDTERLYQEGDIYYEWVKNSIINALNQARFYLNLYNSTHRERLLRNYQMYLNITSTILFQSHSHFLISDKSYAILKEDVEYMISELLNN